jgi:hypothetical protein
MYIGLYVKVPVIFDRLNFIDIFSKNTQISKLVKILLVGAELFHADRRTKGRTDLTKPISLSAILRTYLNRDSPKRNLLGLRELKLKICFMVPQ